MCVGLIGHAQKDHNTRGGFMVNSVNMQLIAYHTQTTEQDTLRFLSSYVWQYFSVENDTLYANIPSGYISYGIDDPVTMSAKGNKEMVTIKTGTNTRWFRERDLIGHKVAIWYTKEPAVIYLSL